MSSQKDRKKRVPVGKRKLSMTPDPTLIPKDCVGRWVNDVAGNLQRFLDGGYVFATTNKRNVKDKVGEDVDNENTSIDSRVSKIVDKSARTNSDPVRAYLMYIKKEYYEEDQISKMEDVDKIDRQIKNPIEDIKEDRGHFSANIKYEA